MKRAALALLLIAVAGCASKGASSSNPYKPSVDITQSGAIFFGSGTRAPVTLQVHVTNHSKEPMVVRKIRLDSWSMLSYAIYPVERLFKETLAPGEMKTLIMNAAAYTNQTRLTPNEPLSLRTQVDYEVLGKQYRDMYIDSSVAR